MLDYSERRTRACLAALPDGTLRGRGRARGARGRPRAAPARACSSGDELVLDFAGSAAPARGQPQLPARGHPLGLPVRRARAHRPRHPAHRRRLPPDRGARAPRAALLNARPGAAVAAGNVETSSRVADLVLARLRPRAGPGHDEQPHARQRALLLLRDARRRPGRMRGRRRPERRARRDEQHAQHARSRRSSANSRCAWSSTRCAAAPAAPGATAAATASCASSRRSREMTFSLIAERRRHAPRGRRGRRARGAAGATCSTAARCPARRPARCAPGQRLRIETPGGGGFGA